MNGKTHRFAAAALAIGISEAALRNWLTRNKVDLHDARPEGGWRGFTEADIIVLAVASHLVGFGMPVATAIDGVRTRLGFANLETYENLPEVLYASRHWGSWVIETDFGILGMHYRPGIPASFIQVNIRRCIADTRHRLAMVEKGAGVC